MGEKKNLTKQMELRHRRNWSETAIFGDLKVKGTSKWKHVQQYSILRNPVVGG